ncbi:hypothetical protein BDY24DRAFT_372810 [Mrakia frigida]|uniref:uncharacterized protein n=1 Tax=Mrakia frigida TaxID=29902 RepID=UPI003FCBF073
MSSNIAAAAPPPLPPPLLLPLLLLPKNSPEQPAFFKLMISIQIWLFPRSKTSETWRQIQYYKHSAERKSSLGIFSRRRILPPIKLSSPSSRMTWRCSKKSPPSPPTLPSPGSQTQPPRNLRKWPGLEIWLSGFTTPSPPCSLPLLLRQ